jgi:hypothetical protein
MAMAETAKSDQVFKAGLARHDNFFAATGDYGSARSGWPPPTANHRNGSAPKTFAGAEVGVSGQVLKSAGDLQDNQLWQVLAAGYQTTTGYDATAGWAPQGRGVRPGPSRHAMTSTAHLDPGLGAGV